MGSEGERAVVEGIQVEIKLTQRVLKYRGGEPMSDGGRS